jgi:hypothetical protein
MNAVFSQAIMPERGEKFPGFSAFLAEGSLESPVRNEPHRGHQSVHEAGDYRIPGGKHNSNDIQHDGDLTFEIPS